MIKLYYAPHTCSLASHIALEDAGADYSTVRISFAAEEQRKPEYLAINPKGRVPALVTDQGILTETPAILAFIAQSFPRARLAPLEIPFRLRRCRPSTAICARPCTSPMPTACAAIAGPTIPPPSRRCSARCRSRSAACYELIEHKMLGGPWVMGETYTICDPYLFTIAQWLEGDGVDPSRFPKVMAHRRRMSERPEVQRAISEQLA